MRMLAGLSATRSAGKIELSGQNIAASPNQAGSGEHVMFQSSALFPPHYHWDYAFVLNARYDQKRYRRAR